MNKLLFIQFLFLSSLTFAQEKSNSPYSMFGLGEIQNPASVRSINLGGSGTAIQSPKFLNTQNPATLPALLLTTMNFEVFAGKVKQSNSSQKRENTIAQIKYLGLSFPIITSKWVTAISVRPFSHVSYYIINTQKVIDDTLFSYFSSHEYIGKGGLTEMNLSNGILLHKNFSIGLNSSFIFGNIKHEIYSYLSDSSGLAHGFKTVITNSTSVRDFYFKPGFLFHKSLSKERLLTVGLTYGFPNKLNATKVITFDQRSGSDFIIIRDTSSLSEDGKIELPVFLNFGVVYEKKNKFLINSDFAYNQWSDFKHFNNSDSLKNNFSVAVGFEFTPEATAMGNILKTISYGIGFQAGTNPVYINNNQLNEFGINFGLTIPVPKSFSSFVLGMKYGQRGTHENNLIKEEFYLGYLSINLGERWFLKPKVE